MQEAGTLINAQTLAGTAVASAASGIAAPDFWSAIGIGPSVLFMALSGTALGLLFTPPGGSRRRLFVLAVIYTMVAAATAVLLSELLDLAAHRYDGALAMLLAFFAQSAIPALGESINDRLKNTIGGNNDYGEPDTWRIDDGFDRRNRDADHDHDGTWKGD